MELMAQILKYDFCKDVNLIYKQKLIIHFVDEMYQVLNILLVQTIIHELG